MRSKHDKFESIRSSKSTNKQQIISGKAVHYGIVLDLRLPN